MKKRGWFLLIIYILTLSVCAVLIYLVPGVLGLRNTTYVAEFGEIEVANEVDAYVFRDDYVYTADVAGDVNRLVEAGTLVKGNSRVVELTGEGNAEISENYTEILKALAKDISPATEGVTEKSGYVSYVIDGKEDVFTPGNISNVNKILAESIEDYSMTETPADKCAKGEPIFRVSNNGDWHILFWVGNEFADRYVEGGTVKLVAGDNSLDGVIEVVKSGSEITRIELRTDMYDPYLLNNRKVSVKVVSSEASGVILRSSSIIEKDGKKGVLVKDKIGDNHFKPVYVEADNGTEAAVYSEYFMDSNMEFVETVKTYDEIVIAPTEEEIAAAVDVNDKYKNSN